MRCVLTLLLFALVATTQAQVSRRMDEAVNDYVLRQQFSGTVLVARAG
ncbi:MAG: hypothetical protein SFY70_08165 [Bacteroidia bacterium]|nr:hypothetical protein [Bacteroidia bacterium]